VKKHAVIGSREGAPLQEVALHVNKIFETEGAFILVSGGGPVGSVNHMAEHTALALGCPVISFRATQIEDYNFDHQFIAEEWRLHRGAGTVVKHEPSFADWKSAAQYRSALIVERAQTATAFHYGQSRGTAFEIELFEMAGKPVEVIPPF
jgi:hypothetical protein